MTDPLDRIAAALERLSPPPPAAGRSRWRTRPMSGATGVLAAARAFAPLPLALRRHRRAEGGADRQSRADWLAAMPRRTCCSGARAAPASRRWSRAGVAAVQAEGGNLALVEVGQHSTRSPPLRGDRRGPARLRDVRRRSRLRRRPRSARAALDARGRGRGAARQRPAARHLEPPPPDPARHRRAGQRDQPARLDRRPARARRPFRPQPRLPRRSTRTAISRSSRAMPALTACRFDAHDAVNWATRRGSRSGRVAWQYVVELAGRAGLRL